ncbi:hypothetical protein V6K52_14640 [Knoellia sp. S7-12]|uniref:PseG/SpsG family protein n=1 Tax=Knoellia sp. S7-12 TaxID=3126698 RepID=UPI003369AAA2
MTSTPTLAWFAGGQLLVTAAADATGSASPDEADASEAQANIHVMPLPSPTPSGHRLRHLPEVHVGLRCDAAPSTGVGHLARCLALADELRSRAVGVTVIGRIEGAPWLTEAVGTRGIEVIPAPDEPGDLAALCQQRGLDAAILDGYDLPPGTGGRLREAGLTVLALRDGPHGSAQSADIHLDQNLGAAPISDLPRGEVSLAGVGFSLLRDDILSHRKDLTAPPDDSIRLRVLAFFGGTDAAGAAPTLAPLVLATGLSLDLIVVAATGDIADQLARVAVGEDQRLTVIDPTPDIAAHAATADLVVTAAGSSVWELLAIGSTTAVTTVADNQLLGYAALAEQRVVAPLGALADLRDQQASSATARLRHLLGDHRARLDLARRGRALIDGRGRERVADALLAAVEARPHP